MVERSVVVTLAANVAPYVGPMATAAAATKGVSTSAAGLNTALDKQGATAATSAAQMGTLQKATGQAGTGFSAMGLGVTVAGAALGKFAFDSIQAASNLQETQNKISVVFGESADEVRAFGETAVGSLGMSENAALAAAGTFGSFFDAAGLSSEAAADMSIEMVQLATDMASFNNADPSEVLVNLRSGLAGEAEPLRKFGVFLNEAAVRAKAMELGLVGANGQLSDSAKIQARYAIILEQSTKAQGDFARTSDSLANKQRILAASVEDLKTRIGEQLLPAMSGVVTVATELLDVTSELDAKSKSGSWGLDALIRTFPTAQMGLDNLKSAVGLFSDETDESAGSIKEQTRVMDGQTLATYKARDASGMFAEQTEEAQLAVEEATEAAAAWKEELAKVASGFVEPLDAYTTTLAAKEAAEQKTAQATADATGSAEDSWEDYATGVTVSIGEYLDELEAQVTAQDAWADNMIVLAGRVSDDTLAELARMGPEGAPLVADLVNASDAEIKRLDDLMARGTQEAMTAIANTITGAGPLLRHVAATSGQAAADSLARALAAGTTDVRSAAAAWGFAIDEGVPDTVTTTAIFLDNTASTQLAAYKLRLASGGVGGVPKTVTTTGTGGPMSAFDGSSVGRQFPLPGGRSAYRITQGPHPVNALDYGASSGTPVYASFSGTVETNDLGNRSYGKYYRLFASGQRPILGAHLSGFARGPGRISQGSLIGWTGTTGNSTGPHLHLENFDTGGILGHGSVARNMSGRPERILNPAQTESFDKLVAVLAGGVGGSGGGTTVTLVNQGVIGSQMELQNWLAKSMDTLRRQGRAA